ncbi:MAG: tRNA epoxyqueuosine(34) reductase QueG [Planctomycetota bacterium]|jgi:epoxyqueuosine reductase
MNSVERVELIGRLAAEAGFEAVGIAPASPILRISYFEDWLSRGYGGEMSYLGRHQDLRVDPRRLLSGARSIIVVAHNYGQCSEIEFPSIVDGGGECDCRGRVGRYAWGRDYHEVVGKKLHGLVEELGKWIDEPFESRVCVDTAPLMEREVAAAAGIGWIGKNTMLLNRSLGSYFFLGEIITTLDLAPCEPQSDRCGTCKRCLEACPTGALIGPYRMDASRCISYLTIEHRMEIPVELQPMIGDWVYGCPGARKCALIITRRRLLMSGHINRLWIIPLFLIPSWLN